jgi:hypothetical protein
MRTSRIALYWNSVATFRAALAPLYDNKHAVLSFRLRFIQTLLDFINGRQHHSTVCIHLRYCTILAHIVFTKTALRTKRYV